MRWLCFLWCISSIGCFGASRLQQRYFVLHLGPSETPVASLIPGAARVRDLDAESTYDKFQIVVRQNPYELTYRKTDVWAVKPNRMVSDLLARRLLEYGLFSTVSRELGEQRPDYSLGGDLHAVELYDSGDRLFAHLSVTLTLSRYRDGAILWSASYDERREVPSLKFSHAIRIMSELLTEIVTDAARSMAELGQPVAPDALPQGDTQPGAEEPDGAPRTRAPDAPVFVEETPTDVRDGKSK